MVDGLTNRVDLVVAMASGKEKAICSSRGKRLEAKNVLLMHQVRSLVGAEF